MELTKVRTELFFILLALILAQNYFKRVAWHWVNICRLLSKSSQGIIYSLEFSTFIWVFSTFWVLSLIPLSYVHSDYHLNLHLPFQNYIKLNLPITHSSHWVIANPSTPKREIFLHKMQKIGQKLPNLASRKLKLLSFVNDEFSITQRLVVK